MKTTTFETAKVGDRVWSLQFGWGKISKINDYSCYSSYPIDVEFDSGGFIMFTLDGRLYKNHVMQSLFWDEVVIEVPTKPLPDLPVDAKVVVWDNGGQKFKRHFSHFENGTLYAFDDGRTSWAGGATSPWRNWELAE